MFLATEKIRIVMPAPRKSAKDTQREQLAALLEEAVLFREAAALAIGKTPASMKVAPKKRPPFYQKTKGASTALYPQSWIDEFKAEGKVVCRKTGKKIWGSQTWPTGPLFDTTKRDRTAASLAKSVDDLEYIRRVSHGDWSY